jgi:hypothetical protein
MWRLQSCQPSRFLVFTACNLFLQNQHLKLMQLSQTRLDYQVLVVREVKSNMYDKV